MEGEWTTSQVGEIFDLVTGYAFKSADFTDFGVPVIKIKNVKAGEFSEHEFSYVPESFLDCRDDKIARYGDLLISMSGNRHDGSPDTWVGKVAQFRKPDKYLINQRVGALRVKQNARVDSRFASYLLSSISYQQLFIAIATSSGGQANLSPAQILGAPMRYPDLGKQHAIAHILGTLDDKIELNRKMNETLEEMARAVFKSWFVDFDPVIDNALRAGKPIPPEFQERAERRKAALAKSAKVPTIGKCFPDEFQSLENGWVPKGWKVFNLGSLCEFVYGKALKEEDRRVGDIPVYGSNGQVGWHNEQLVKGPGIVVGRKGNPGVVTWAPKSFFVIDTAFYVHPKVEVISSRHFLYYALREQRLADLRSDSAVPGLNRNMAYMSNQLLPDQNVLNVFDECVNEKFQKIYLTENESRTLCALRDELLPKLLSGQIQVKDAENFVQEAV